MLRLLLRAKFPMSKEENSKIGYTSFLRIYQFPPGVLTSVVAQSLLCQFLVSPIEPASLRACDLPKSKMAANLDRIQQQMQTELEKFKSVQKGNSYQKCNMKN